MTLFTELPRRLIPGNRTSSIVNSRRTRTSMARCYKMAVSSRTPPTVAGLRVGIGDDDEQYGGCRSRAAPLGYERVALEYDVLPRAVAVLIGIICL